MLVDEIIDAAQVLARRDALWQEKQDDEILQQISAEVQESLSAHHTHGKLAIGAYRHYERKCWALHNRVELHSTQEV